MYTFSTALAVFVTLFFVLTTAQNSTRCGLDDFSAYTNGYNATGSISLPGPKLNESSPDSTWTWSNYVVKNNASGSQGLTWNQIGLQTSPVQNLSDGANLEYTGCLIAFTEVASAGSKKAESDDGTCTSVFTPECIKELISTVNASAISRSNSNPAIRVSCLDLLGDIASSSSAKCAKQWGSSAATQFLPSNFSTPRSSDGCPPVNPGDSNSTARAFFGWAPGSAQPSGNYTEYDLAIRTPVPIITAYWLKGTSGNQAIVSPGSWAHTDLFCIHSNKTTSGSRTVKEADDASGAQRAGSLSVGMLFLVGLTSYLIM